MLNPSYTDEDMAEQRELLKFELDGSLTCLALYSSPTPTSQPIHDTTQTFKTNRIVSCQSYCTRWPMVVRTLPTRTTLLDLFQVRCLLLRVATAGANLFSSPPTLLFTMQV